MKEQLKKVSPGKTHEVLVSLKRESPGQYDTGESDIRVKQVSPDPDPNRIHEL